MFHEHVNCVKEVSGVEMDQNGEVPRDENDLGSPQDDKYPSRICLEIVVV